MLYYQLAKKKGDVKRTILETLSLSIYFLQQNQMNVILLVGAAQKSTDSIQVIINNTNIYDSLASQTTDGEYKPVIEVVISRRF